MKVFLPSASTTLRQAIQKLLLPGRGRMFNISRIAALHPPQLSTTGEPDTARLPQPPGRESRFQHAKGAEMTPQRHLFQPSTP
jgi:hypothetical protein